MNEPLTILIALAGLVVSGAALYRNYTDPALGQIELAIREAASALRELPAINKTLQEIRDALP